MACAVRAVQGVTGGFGNAVAGHLHNPPKTPWFGEPAGSVRTSRNDFATPCVPRPYLLLQLTTDLHLAQVRSLVLSKAGFQVINAVTREAKELLEHGDFVAALFCHSLKEHEAFRMLTLLRSQTNQVRTMRLSRRPENEAGCYDCVLEAPVHPAVLVKEALKLHEAVTGGMVHDA